MNGYGSTGPTGVESVTALFAEFGSFVGEETPAVPLIGPVDVSTLKVSVMLTASPGSIVGPLQLTDGPGEGFAQVQFAGFEADT